MRTSMISKQLWDEERIEALIARAIAGDKRALGDLWVTLTPSIESMAGRFRVANRLSERREERDEIVLRVMEQLHADGFRSLRQLHAVMKEGGGAGRAWLSGVVRNVAIQFVRDHPENSGRRAFSWVELVPLTDEIEEDRVPDEERIVRAIDAGRIMAWAEEHLGPDQLSALRLWRTGCDDEEIAAALGLADAGAAHRLVRSAQKRLRDRFAGRGGERKEESTGPLVTDRSEKPSRRE